MIRRLEGEDEDLDGVPAVLQVAEESDAGSLQGSPLLMDEEGVEQSLRRMFAGTIT